MASGGSWNPADIIKDTGESIKKDPLGAFADVVTLGLYSGAGSMLKKNEAASGNVAPSTSEITSPELTMQIDAAKKRKLLALQKGFTSTIRTNNNNQDAGLLSSNISGKQNLGE